MPNRLEIQIIKDLLDYDEDLTEWERGFINSLADLDNDVELSEKQVNKLYRINTKLIEAGIL